MTYPMSPLKRALLPRQEVAVAVLYWHSHDDAKNSRFFRILAAVGQFLHPVGAPNDWLSQRSRTGT